MSNKYHHNVFLDLNFKTYGFIAAKFFMTWLFSRFGANLMKVIPQTRRVHYIWYLRIYNGIFRYCDCVISFTNCHLCWWSWSKSKSGLRNILMMTVMCEWSVFYGQQQWLFILYFSYAHLKINLVNIYWDSISCSTLERNNAAKLKSLLR